jgi:signal transduction histidine kinase
VSALLEEHREHLADFLTKDPRGSRIPDYLSALSGEIESERAEQQKSLESLEKHVEHIRAIVQVQQEYAKTTLLEEECDLRALVEDALRIQLATDPSGRLRVTKEFEALPPVRVDKHKMLRILVNLLSNAQDALTEVAAEQRHLKLRLEADTERVRLQVMDNGAGIAPHVRERLFEHGFTTRKGGHGFGLHASALAAKQLGGRLMLESAGPGQGATATLELPLSILVDDKTRAS